MHYDFIHIHNNNKDVKFIYFLAYQSYHNTQLISRNTSVLPSAQTESPLIVMKATNSAACTEMLFHFAKAEGVAIRQSVCQKQAQ